jgi:hypothetical protein
MYSRGTGGPMRRRYLDKNIHIGIVIIHKVEFAHMALILWDKERVGSPNHELIEISVKQPMKLKD